MPIPSGVGKLSLSHAASSAARFAAGSKPAEKYLVELHERTEFMSGHVAGGAA